ncbi:MAG: lysostaphin resistance A-like protein [Steroidobacteraceae bacterium]
MNRPSMTAIAWVALWAALLAATSYGLVLVGLLPAEVLRSANPPGIKPGEVELAHAMLAVVTVATTVIMALLTRETFTLVQLSRALSFWAAAVLMSGLFLLSHTANMRENPLGLFAAALVGLVLAYSFRRTGALWFAIGFHAAWDYTESFLFGVPDSGGVLRGALMRSTIHGPAWLTGGSAGPRG